MDNGDRIQSSENLTATFAPLPELSRGMEATFATARLSHPQTAQTVTLTVAMPVYNERETIREIVRRVLEVPIALEIVIVDDGSTDGSRAILTEIAQQHSQVRVVLHEQNQGKGAAIITAIGYAQGEFLIVQDADLEYDPQAYTALLPLLLDKQADVVYGSRFKGSVKGMKFANLLANRILTFAANVLFPGARLTDEATCYKMFRLSVLRTLNLRARRFDFCPEVTAKVLKRGYKIHEVPIDYTARSVSQGKKIRWTDGVDALMALIRYRFRE